jgi:hypothetical protein
MNMSSEKRLQFAKLRGICSQRTALPRQQNICYAVLPIVQLWVGQNSWNNCSLFSTCLCTIKPQQDGQH